MTTTLFEGLQAKAEAWCRDFDRYKEECKMFAEGLRIDFISYLGAKSTDIEFHVLDEHLERVRDAGTTLSPRLQSGNDGFIYFGITVFSSWRRSAWMSTYAWASSAFADSGASARTRWRWAMVPPVATGHFLKKPRPPLRRSLRRRSTSDAVRWGSCRFSAMTT